MISIYLLQVLQKPEKTTILSSPYKEEHMHIQIHIYIYTQLHTHTCFLLVLGVLSKQSYSVDLHRGLRRSKT